MKEKRIRSTVVAGLVATSVFLSGCPKIKNEDSLEISYSTQDIQHAHKLRSCVSGKPLLEEKIIANNPENALRFINSVSCYFSKVPSGDSFEKLPLVEEKTWKRYHGVFFCDGENEDTLYLHPFNSDLKKVKNQGTLVHETVHWLQCNLGWSLVGQAHYQTYQTQNLYYEIHKMPDLINTNESIERTLMNENIKNVIRWNRNP